MPLSKTPRDLQPRAGWLSAELALLVPLLALLVLGGVEYAWMRSKVRSLDAVAHQAALVGASRHGTAAMVRTATERLLEEAGLAELDYQLEVAPGGLPLADVAAGEPVSVSLSVPFASLSLTGLSRPLPAIFGASIQFVARGEAARRGAL